MKGALTPLAKIVLLSLGLLARKSAEDPAIQKKIYSSGTVTLIISNKEIKEIIKIVKSLRKSILLIVKRLKNEAKEQKGENLVMLLGTLTASLLGSALIGKGVTKAIEGVIRAGENF